MKAYLDILKEVKTFGVAKENRTGTDTIMIPGTIFKHNMKDGFPITTCKFVPIKKVATELEFFLRGLRSKKWLQERGCHIWDEWCNPKKVPYGNDEASKELMKQEDDLGKIYGYQWTNYNDSGINQIKNIIDTLKKNPNDRRMICTAWNPQQLDEMALPPCHYGFNVGTSGRDKETGKYLLNLAWNQRSVDTFIGLPFDIASYGILLELICKEVDMIPNQLIGFLFDTHIYENHIEAVDIVLNREFHKLPKLKINNFKSIWNWKFDDIELENYTYGKSLKVKIAV
jgi:thymidylate synthase